VRDVTGDEALSLAIDVFRAPSLRLAARAKPVPEDTRELLLLAAGQPARLADAAARTGLERGELLEASRFFVREVLLHPDADDYRMLGLRHGADLDSIKTHHRILQAWLHPDRAGTQAERVLASRVNAAWNRLRHDRRDPAPATAPAATPRTAPRYAPRWVRIEADDGQAPHPHRQAIAPLALLLVCGVLLGLVSRPAAAPDAGGEDDDPGPAAALFDGLALHRADETPTSATVDAIDSAPPARPHPPPEARRVPPPSAAVATAPPPAAPRPATAATRGAAHAPVPSTAAAASPPARHATDDAIAGDGHATEDRATAGRGRATAARDDAASAHAAASASAGGAPAGAPGDDAQPAPADLALAQQRLDSLLAFVTQQRALPPPIWRNVVPMEDAERIRRSMVAGGDARAPIVLREQTRWHHRPGRASASVPVLWPPPDPARQRLHAAFTRYDGEWLVDSVILEDAPP